MMDRQTPLTRFDRIVLIFNPDRTGLPAHRAGRLQADLAARLPAVPVEMWPTGAAGHARELARSVAAAGHPLIVSVSGDGGYNEVVNGIMDVPSSPAVAAVLAAGNANDHHRSTGTGPLIEAILHGGIRRIDLLRLSVGGPGQARSRYAHSYIGFGLTAAMAVGIEKGGKGRLRELFAVARTLPGLRPFEISREDGARATFDSLILANISRMAKYGTVSEALGPTDGKFEVITLPHAGPLSLALMTLRAVTLGLGSQPSVSSYSFATIEPIPLQLDGEVMNIPARTPVLVQSVPSALSIIG